MAGGAFQGAVKAEEDRLCEQGHEPGRGSVYV